MNPKDGSWSRASRSSPVVRPLKCPRAHLWSGWGLHEAHPPSPTGPSLCPCAVLVLGQRPSCADCKAQSLQNGHPVAGTEGSGESRAQVTSTATWEAPRTRARRLLHVCTQATPKVCKGYSRASGTQKGEAPPGGAVTCGHMAAGGL